MVFKRFRMATQLLILVLATALALIALLVASAIVQSRSSLQQQATDQSTAITVAAGNLIAEALAAHDLAHVHQIVTSIVQPDGIDQMSVFDQTGALLIADKSLDETSALEPEEDADLVQVALRADHPLSRADSEHVDIAVPVRVNGQLLGVVVGQTSLEQAADVADATIPLQLAIGLGVALLAGLAALTMARYFATPLSRLSAAATAIGQGQLDLPPEVQGSVEMNTLARAFSQMVHELRTSREGLAQQQRTLETRVSERTADLQRALAELQESANAREQLSATVRELSSPIVPVIDGILVMPLVGVIDTQRAALLMSTLLRGVEHHRASIVILDVTGVPIIDTQVARTLLDAARAVKLLGTQTILVGLRPELAQTIVGLGLDLTGLRTQADLQSGVSYAMRHHRALEMVRNEGRHAEGKC